MPFDYDKFATNPLTHLGMALMANANPGAALQQGMATTESYRSAQEEKKLKELLAAIQMEKLKQPDSALGKLLAERDALPAGDPNRALYDENIKKQNTITDPYGMPIPVFDPKTGQAGFAPKSAVMSGGYQPLQNNPDVASKKPMPATAIKMQNEELDAIGTANSIKADMESLVEMIDSGKLDVGPIDNLVSEGLNWAGMSTGNSRNYATLNASLEKLRNDSLRLNKGVQTEGDSIRAWNEILANLNDLAFVKQRLQDVIRLNDRAAELRKLNIDNLRANYGKDPLDTSAYNVGSAILGQGSGPDYSGGSVSTPPAGGAVNYKSKYGLD